MGISDFMKMRSMFIQLLREDERKEMKKTWKGIFVIFFPEITQTVAKWIYIAADCRSQTNIVTVKFSVLPYNIFTAQIPNKLYSVQLNCTCSKSTVSAPTYSAAQQRTNCLLNSSTPCSFKLYMYQYVYIQSCR